MKPIDYRLETWEQVRQRADYQRGSVLELWRQYGPGTTAQLADATGWSLWLIRPRTTELVQLGLVELATDKRGREGVYRAVPEAIARQRFEEQQAAARRVAEQTLMKV
jgi:hypothetical protein